MSLTCWFVLAASKQKIPINAKTATFYREIRTVNVKIQVASPEEIQIVKTGLVDIYRWAFCVTPYAKSAAEVEVFAHFLPIHSVQMGFRLVIAVEIETGKTVGFAYGRAVGVQHSWSDLVAPQLRLAGLGGWLDNAYQVVEMAVMPSAQRKGIGRRLHDRLLEDQPYDRALLTTMAAETAAFQSYLSRDWEVLQDAFTVPDVSRQYRVMGLELPALITPGCTT